MLYLAYGSNMAQARIEARLGRCARVGVAQLAGYSLRYHKRGADGSGKCDAFFTGHPATGNMYGVLFDLSQSQCVRLDTFEGADYRRQTVSVQSADASHEAYAYVAYEHAIEPNLAPYPWYHAFVLHGATVGGLPSAYVEVLRAVVTVPDPDPERQAANARILEG